MKVNGDFISAIADNYPVFSYTFVYVSVYTLTDGNVFVSYAVYIADSGVSAYCIADKSVLKGSGTSKLSINVDTTTFNEVVIWPPNIGECITSMYGTPPAAPLGQVSVEVQRNDLNEEQFSGTRTYCNTYEETKFCQSSTGHSEYGSAIILSGNVLGYDVSSLPN